MANDMQWPSEDEDFDAKTDSNKAKSFSNQPEKLVAKPVSKPVNKVSVAVSEPDNYQSEEANQEIEQAFEKPVVSRDQIDQPDAPEEQQASEAVLSDQQAEAAPETAEAEEPQVETFAPVANTPKTPKNHRDIAHIALPAVLALVLLVVGFYAYGLNNKNQDLTNKNKNLTSQVATLNANPQIAIQKQTDELIAKIGALMDLPKGEAPTVANVTDAAAAKKQSAFFNNAENGDKVLMYVKAGQAILYRPSTNKIVLVAPLTFNADAAAKTPATTTPAKTTR